MKYIIGILFLAANCALAASGDDDYFEKRAEVIEKIQIRMSVPGNKEVLDLMRKNGESIRKSLGASYAGSWVDYDEEDRAYQVIAVTDLAAKNRVHVDYRLEFVEAERNIEQLNAVYREIERFREENGLRLVIYYVQIEPRINKVLVGAPLVNHERIIGILQNLKLDMNAVQLQEANSTVTLYGKQVVN